jgi:hypothetical protein
MLAPHSQLPSADVIEAATRAMGPHIGYSMARAATVAHCRKLGIGPIVDGLPQLEALLQRLGSGLNVFVGKARSADVVSEIRRALVPAEEAGR